jgi:hypothetical protein
VTGDGWRRITHSWRKRLTILSTSPGRTWRETAPLLSRAICVSSCAKDAGRASGVSISTPCNRSQKKCEGFLSTRYVLAPRHGTGLRRLLGLRELPCEELGSTRHVPQVRVDATRARLGGRQWARRVRLVKNCGERHGPASRASRDLLQEERPASARVSPLPKRLAPTDAPRPAG